jgi:hypothetical protein
MLLSGSIVKRFGVRNKVPCRGGSGCSVLSARSLITARRRRIDYSAGGR